MIRKDATIDRRQVPCPNASLIGYGKRNAQVGDVIRFEEHGRIRLGRMIGRIEYAPAIGETPRIKNWILAVCLGEDLTHMAERWVNPETVIDVTPVQNQGEVCSAFFSDTLTKTPMGLVRLAANGLWSTVTAYLDWRKESGI